MEEKRDCWKRMEALSPDCLTQVLTSESMVTFEELRAITYNSIKMKSLRLENRNR